MLLTYSNANVVVYERVYLKTSRYHLSSQCYFHHVLQVNDAVEIKVESFRNSCPRLINSTTKKNTRLAIFPTGAVIGMEGGTPWIAVTEMKHVEVMRYKAEKSGSQNISLILLNVNLRKLLPIHCCGVTSRCKFDATERLSSTQNLLLVVDISLF